MLTIARFISATTTWLIFIFVISVFSPGIVTASDTSKSRTVSMRTLLYRIFSVAADTDIDQEAEETITEDEQSGMELEIKLSPLSDPGILIFVSMVNYTMMEDLPPTTGDLEIHIALGKEDFCSLMSQHQLTIRLNTGEDGLTGIIGDTPVEMIDVTLIVDLDKEDRPAPTLTLVGESSVTVEEDVLYEDTGATATEALMSISLKTGSEGTIVIGETELPFSEDILNTMFAPNDITDAVTATVVDSVGDDITELVSTSDSSYIFPDPGDYRIIYSVTDENGKSADEVERQVTVTAYQEPESPQDVEVVEAEEDDSSNNSLGCFINTMIN